MKIEWKTTEKPLEYENTVKFMENRVELITQNKADELVWFLEHPAIYTAGSSAIQKDLINPLNLPVHSTGRGGQYTYHGPGQRVVYLMLDLKHREKDVRKYVQNLENWVISSFAELGLKSETKEGLIGIWTKSLTGSPVKIAAIGIRVRKWIAYHGISINVSPDIEHFKGIIPCGISKFGVTSLTQLGINISYSELDQILKRKFHDFF